MKFRAVKLFACKLLENDRCTGLKNKKKALPNCLVCGNMLCIAVESKYLSANIIRNIKSPDTPQSNRLYVRK